MTKLSVARRSIALYLGVFSKCRLTIAFGTSRNTITQLTVRRNSHTCILMIRNYPELKSEIARLEAEAERVRRFELPTVIAELNLLIERYQLTESMIFGAARSGTPGKPKTVMVPKYVDQVTGNTWTGRGPTPAWLSDALSAGTLAENLLVS